jgi:hypothetical protein
MAVEGSRVMQRSNPCPASVAILRRRQDRDVERLLPSL